jgi:hypothetical protein
MKMLDNCKIGLVWGLLIGMVLALAWVVSSGCEPAPQRQVVAPFEWRAQQGRKWVDRHIGNPNKLCVDGKQWLTIHGYADVPVEKWLCTVGNTTLPEEVEILSTELSLTKRVVRVHGKIKPTRITQEQLDAIDDVEFTEVGSTSAKIGFDMLCNEGFDGRPVGGFGMFVLFRFG